MSDSPTARHPLAPNLLGIGCAKCGTTSLAKLLSAHPEISSPKKEFHFFDQGSVTPEGFADYVSKFSPARWRMDFTPSYIMDRNARFLIKEWLGTDLKFLVILRNPVHRAYSHYCHAVKNWLPGSKWVEEMGYPVETLSFSGAIEAEFARMVFDPHHSRHLSYFAKGLYYQQLTRWLELFPRENFHIMVLENVMKNPQKEIARLGAWLDVSLDPSQLQKTNSQSEGEVDPGIYSKLQSKYEAESLLLARYLDLDLSSWLEKPKH